jgi:hypothetical protein
MSSEFGPIEPANAIFFERQHEAEQWKLHVNNDEGFRDLFDIGDPRILVVGDSFVRGSLVNNGEAFADLLDLWAPSTGVRAYALGGWGTGQELRAYRTLGAETPHDLVILAYYVGNDLTDNVKTGYRLEDDGANAKLAFDETALTPPSAPARFRRFLFKHLLSLRVLQSAAMAGAGGDYFQKPAQDLDGLMAVARQLLDKFQEESAKNGAELLIVAIPDFNEFVSGKARAAAARQTAIIEDIAARHDHVFALVLRDAVAAAGPDRVYGRNNKHFNRYGQYLAAREIARFIGVDAPEFSADADVRIRPDCNRAQEYARQLNIYGPK